MNRLNRQLRKAVFAAVIAALYVAMTLAFMPISYGLIQFRISEVLTILPYFFPVSVPGLFIGCLIANIFSPELGIIDMFMGSAATLFAALITMRIGKSEDNEALPRKALACLPPVIINAVFVGAMLATYMVGIGEATAFWSILPECALFVGLGQATVLYVLGLPLLVFLPRMGVIDRLKYIYNYVPDEEEE